jgi:hypothetical protein
MKISIYAPDAKERLETARQNSILHPERIVGNPDVIPRKVGQERALPPQSNSVKYADILLSVLPPIVHIRKESDKAALRWSLERMMQELRDPQPGSFLVVQHLAHMMLVQALRLHLVEGTEGGVG